LYTAKRTITALCKVNIEDPGRCARRLAYLLEEDRFICPPEEDHVYWFNIARDYSDSRKNESNWEDRLLLSDS